MSVQVSQESLRYLWYRRLRLKPRNFNGLCSGPHYIGLLLMDATDPYNTRFLKIIEIHRR